MSEYTNKTAKEINIANIGMRGNHANRMSTWCVFLPMAMALAGCGSLSSGIAEDVRSADHLVWPTLHDTNSTVRNGSYTTYQALSLLNKGMDKRQVLSLVVAPHFGEGIAGGHEWNYLFRLRRTDELGAVAIFI